MKFLITAVLGFCTALINLILLPINLVLENSLPGLTYALNSFSSLLNYLIPFSKWVLSWLPFSTDFYTFVISTLIFIYTIPLLINTIKLVVKWWHYLVP